jgi:hypothetical protein
MAARYGHYGSADPKYTVEEQNQATPRPTVKCVAALTGDELKAGQAGVVSSEIAEHVVWTARLKDLPSDSILLLASNPYARG